ncbi:MAG: DUF1684 domain-containing protein, partial [Acidobacteria bacterium]|nr:DUF1684 domain-containing protein [Acidobacteriota bacterium]
RNPDLQRTTIVLLLAASFLAGSCSWTPADNSADPAYEREIRAFRERRVVNLTRETGWLTLTGLHWLEQGENAVGSDPAATVALPEGKAPARVGTIQLLGGSATFVPEGDVPVTIEGRVVTEPVSLAPDTSGNPTVMELGTLQWLLIERAGRFGIRARDREHPARTDFSGIASFPIDEKWRVTARLETYDPPKQIQIQNIIGSVEPLPSPGALVFTLDGREYRLDPITEKGSEELFVIFADGTSGVETYPAGRYLYASMPGEDGTTVLDFNRAYNPPCAFTEFATCPLPPRQNRLDVRITAGEMDFKKGARG